MVNTVIEFEYVARSLYKWHLSVGTPCMIICRDHIQALATREDFAMINPPHTTRKLELLYQDPRDWGKTTSIRFYSLSSNVELRGSRCHITFHPDLDSHWPMSLQDKAKIEELRHTTHYINGRIPCNG